MAITTRLFGKTGPERHPGRAGGRRSAPHLQSRAGSKGRNRGSRRSGHRLLRLGCRPMPEARAIMVSSGPGIATCATESSRPASPQPGIKREQKIDLEGTLQTMGLERLDLWQIHDLRTREDIEEVEAPGGALEAFVEARDAGQSSIYRRHRSPCTKNSGVRG